MNFTKRIRSKLYSSDPCANWQGDLILISIHFIKLIFFKLLSLFSSDKTILAFVSNCGWIHIPPEHALPKIKNDHPSYDSILPKFTNHLSNYFKDLLVLDIGANIGDTAITLINKGGVDKVICVEPCLHFYEILCKNKSLYNLETINCFINNDTNHKLYIKEDDRGNAMISKSSPTDHKNNCDVKTIDDIYYSLCSKSKNNLKLIKIDVEGYDINALQSAKETIAKTQCSVFFEIYPYLIKNNTKKTSFDITALLEELCLYHLCIFDGWGTLISLFDIRTKDFKFVFNKLYNYSSKTMDIWFDGLAVNDENKSILNSFIDENRL
tara:strand:- start:520 stop:1491 length:972 start_codon:yes stop_codon:yes gene_type:complete